MDLRAYALFHCPFDDRRAAYLALGQAVAAGTVEVDAEAVALRDVEAACAEQTRGGASRKLVLVP